ncbi:hypothetical protein FD01_GL000539 [Lacticaseibacillus manihotivorans DSM 13343 = JCM 12514]|uniref:Secreted protein n=1 Tax=Lacticaseibacillus manihotivorans DSM 13343 = JCM 12514 TaxID=1423769 RepID=A0A0R1QMW1_9LACO|nr:hypothetical protein FD01_GL000539 [Lacticaseibacillus manihotivorans DSM 13343 = JCM 12514]
MSALLILFVVTLFSLAAMQQIAQWQAGYQSLLKHEKETFNTRFDDWSRQQSAATSDTKD